MVTAIKLLVKFIKLLVFFDKSSDGALTQFLQKLESMYDSEE